MHLQNQSEWHLALTTRVNSSIKTQGSAQTEPPVGSAVQPGQGGNFYRIALWHPLGQALHAPHQLLAYCCLHQPGHLASGTPVSSCVPKCSLSCRTCARSVCTKPYTHTWAANRTANRYRIFFDSASPAVTHPMAPPQQCTSSNWIDILGQQTSCAWSFRRR